MVSSRNPIISFILTFVFIIVFVSLLALLANVFIFAAIVGVIIYMIVKIKNQLFPKPKLSTEERLRQFAEKMNRYQQSGYSQATREQENTMDDDFVSSKEETSSPKSRGRIIDVEPEK